MKADDPRHGTHAGYMAHRRDKKSACAPCKKAASDAQRAREARQAEEDVALIGGRWINKGLVKRWLPDPIVMSRQESTQDELDLEAAS